ncbi:hypothetical protein KsCSTR_23390 [Candidatus Kuenenia stuttgartiensis]|uniref:Uncharacterized protein n=1 Tax=Kuenenia stuttgartiensis TaxID=174633 RepID=A0A6G7GQ50_KUEST|nr:hypothetical protein KsCSTR_23390 [Candidatus Kuenenia stuttgartiensis]
MLHGSSFDVTGHFKDHLYGTGSGRLKTYSNQLLNHTFLGTCFTSQLCLEER